MNSAKNLMLQKKTTRKQYETVKKMDRQQFEMFCASLYTQGKEAAIKENLTIDEVEGVLRSVKGIGEKRISEAIFRMEKKMADKRRG